MRPIPIIDAMFLLTEARERPMHVGGLHLFQPPPDAPPGYAGDVYRDALRHTEVAPLFQRHPARSLGGIGPWEWEDDERLDLEYHVRHSALPHPGRIRELLALVSRLHGTLLDRNRPLWETHVIEGLEDGRVATYSKMHHALVDGVSAMRLLARSLSPDPNERGMPPIWAERPRPPRDRPRGPEAMLGLARDAVTGGMAIGQAWVTGVRAIARSLDEQATTLPYQAPRSMLNVPITGARRFAAQSWDLDRLRAVAKDRASKLNDVLLAMCAGALRAYLLDHEALPDHPLVAAVPVSLRRDEDEGGEGGDSGNRVGVVLCNLATHLADPQARFEAIVRSMADNKRQMEGLSQEAITLLSAAAFGPLALGPLFRFPAFRKPPFNIIISNVPGPHVPLYWNGARLDGLYPMSIPFDGQALNITATSNVASLDVGLTGCRRSVPSLQRMLDHLETALAELEAPT